MCVLESVSWVEEREERATDESGGAVCVCVSGETFLSRDRKCRTKCADRMYVRHAHTKKEHFMNVSSKTFCELKQQNIKSVK